MNIGLGLENPIGGQVYCKVSYNYKSFITFPYASKVHKSRARYSAIMSGCSGMVLRIGNDHKSLNKPLSV